jgi:protein TonB
MNADRRSESVLSRSAPAIAVICLHAVVLYVLSITMGFVEIPTIAQPVQAVFIPETIEAEPEPEIPVVKPEIAELTPIEEPAPQIEFDEPIVPPAENAMASSDTAINAAEATGTVRELKTSRRIEPAYPATSRRLAEEGTVRVRVLVDERGQPKEVTVGQSSGYTRLDQAALDAVRRWRFVAATDGQKPITTWTQVAITFRLTT